MQDTADYLAHWPQYLPYPYDITREQGPVPNRNAVDWPQSQWAPLYLKSGSPSFQPYRYPKDGELQRVQPLYSTEDTTLSAKRFVFVPSANGGDTASVYESYMPLGDCGCSGYGCPECGGTCGQARPNEGAVMPTWQKVAMAGAVAFLAYIALKPSPKRR
jgi:hypothetical protein